MANEILIHIAESIAADMDIVLPEIISEEVLLQLLATRVAAVVNDGPEPFYQLMYRLDIPEQRLHELDRAGDVAMGVARLIYARQLAKAVSRRANRQKNDSIDPDLKW